MLPRLNAMLLQRNSEINDKLNVDNLNNDTCITYEMACKGYAL